MHRYSTATQRRSGQPGDPGDHDADGSQPDHVPAPRPRRLVRTALARISAVLVAFVALGAVLVGPLAATAQAQPVSATQVQPQRVPLLLPADATEDAKNEAYIEYGNGCVYVPQNIDGSLWHYYCDGHLSTVKLTESNGDRANGLFLGNGYSSDPHFVTWDWKHGNDAYHKLAEAQIGWAGPSDCQDPRALPPLGKGNDGCPNRFKGSRKEAPDPKTKPEDRYNQESFFDYDAPGSPSPGGPSHARAEASSPCEILQGLTKNKIICADPRTDNPCPATKITKISQGNPLLSECKKREAAFVKHYGDGYKDTKAPDTPKGSQCDATTSSSCTDENGNVITANKALLDDNDDDFLKHPITWTRSRLADAASQVSTWWLRMDDPLIDNKGHYGTEKTFQFMLRYTNIITMFLVVVSIIIAAIRMSLSRNGQPASELAKSIVNLIIVSTMVVVVVNALVNASTIFSNWYLVKGLRPDIKENPSPDLAQQAAVDAMKNFTASLGTHMNFFLFIVAALFVIAGSLTQYFYMVTRFFLVITMAGILPLAAAATNTEVGKNWFRRLIGLLAAFILVKPAAVIVFVAGARLWLPQDIADDSLSIEMQFRGLFIIMLITLLLPAMLRIVVVVVSEAAGDEGTNIAVAAAIPAVGAKAVSGALTVGTGLLARGAQGAAFAASHLGGGGGGGGGRPPTPTPGGTGGGAPGAGNGSASTGNGPGTSGGAPTGTTSSTTSTTSTGSTGSTGTSGTGVPGPGRVDHTEASNWFDSHAQIQRRAQPNHSYFERLESMVEGERSVHQARGVADGAAFDLVGMQNRVAMPEGTSSAPWQGWDDWRNNVHSEINRQQSGGTTLTPEQRDDIAQNLMPTGSLYTDPN